MSVAFATSLLALAFPKQVPEPTSSLGVKGSRLGHGLGVAHVQKRMLQRREHCGKETVP